MSLNVAPSTSTPAPSAPAAPAAASPAPAQSSAATPASAPAAEPGKDAPAAPAPAAPAAKPDTQNAAKLLVEARKLQKERDALAKELADAKAEREMLAKLKDPKHRFDAARELGLTYEEYTQHVLSSLGDGKGDGGKPALELPPELQEKLAEVDQLKAEREAEKKAQAEEKAKAQRASAEAGALKFVTDNADKLPLTAALGLHVDLLDSFLMRAKQEGAPPDEADFASQYEAHLEETVAKQVAALAKTSKGRALIEKLLPKPAASPTPDAKDHEPKGRLSMRLSNDLSASPGVDPDLRNLSPKELRARAREAMRQAGRRD